MSAPFVLTNDLRDVYKTLMKSKPVTTLKKKLKKTLQSEIDVRLGKLEDVNTFASFMEPRFTILKIQIQPIE